MRRLRSERISDEELHRAREHVKGRLVLASESTATRMTRNARAMLFDLPVLTLDEMLDKVEAVTVDDLSALSEQIYDPDDLSVACIGRSEELIRGAVAGVAEPLAGG
jgi:predicted Zn-dependent peptidase